MSEPAEKCPHCDQPMSRWAIPDELPFDEDWHYVCFNDDCPYYVNGWKHMEENFGRPASYRHRKNPKSSEYGPLAVWSSEALRQGIIDS